MVNRPNRKPTRERGKMSASTACKVFCLSPVYLAVSAAMAQDATIQDSDEEDGPLEEIVVISEREFFRPMDASTATKFDLAIFETPQSISVLTEDLIDTFRPVDRLELGKYVAGVYNQGGDGLNIQGIGRGLNMRGFRV